MNKGHNKCTVPQGVIKRKSPQKLAKSKKKLYQMAEKLKNNCHIPDLVQAFSEENGGLNLVLRCIKPPACRPRFLHLDKKIRSSNKKLASPYV